MEFKGSIAIATEPETGWTRVSLDLMQWAEKTFGVTALSGKLFVKIESGSALAREFVRRLRLESESFPASTWQIDYSPEELQAASFLSVRCSYYIAEMAKPPEEQLEVAATSALKSPRPLGGIRPFGSVLAVNSSLKRELEAIGLKGLVFTELKIRKPKKDHQTIWRLESSVVLPPSPIPLKQSDGAPFQGDYNKGCLYRGFYRDVELAFLEHEFVAIGDFDFAVTHELIGNYPGGCFRELVVSQRVRQIFKALRIVGMGYTPVRVLGGDESPIRDPIRALLEDPDEK